jgi:UDP-N-acetylglucosamine transferase subunit ALG13
VIFVTVGTHQQRFDRLIAALDQLHDDAVVVQHGHSTAPSGGARAVPFMEFDEMLECLRAARLVITHAGVGSILCARREGHVPVVVPRERRFREHVDDHQLELARALAARGSILAVWDVARLREAVAAVPTRAAPLLSEHPQLAAAVREAILGPESSSHGPSRRAYTSSSRLGAQ